MLWCDKLAKRVSGPQLINDSKTPSGRVHVGALRGVLIHDAVFRTLKDRGIPVRYTFGVDDYDPLDELPAGHTEFFRPYLGAPLCQVPPPPGSSAPDVAEHYIAEFFDIFRELGVEAETYRMRDIYRSGQFNEAIDAILNNAAKVREVYKTVSKSERPDTWYPFQVVCEACGRIGTTEVSDYDGKEVTYTCRPDLVSWATGCGHAGKVSPFDGRGKLPWKLEWTAKWQTFGITIEGAGKDHNTKGGSRDVSAACLRTIFDRSPPLNIPYEFFLVGGAKMSSSKGIGVSARDMADFLPPEILRFVMIRTQPKQPVNFSPDERSVIKIFNDFDRFHTRTYHDPKVSADDRRVYQLSQTVSWGDFYAADFQLVATVAQLPHLDLAGEVEKRKGAPLTQTERDQLARRAQAARYWLEHYASPEERIVLQDALPERAGELTAGQRAFLHQLADRLPGAVWEDSALQTAVFDVARLTPIAPAQAFKALYRVLLDRDSGPKAGNLLAFLDRDFLLKRLQELPYDQQAFWQETAVSREDFAAWTAEHREHITQLTAEAKLGQARPEALVRLGIVEYTVAFDDNKTHLRRVLLGEFTEQDAFDAAVQKYAAING
jgi:lysyl-tRNA synthetase class 1